MGRGRERAETHNSKEHNEGTEAVETMKLELRELEHMLNILKEEKEQTVTVMKTEIESLSLRHRNKEI